MEKQTYWKYVYVGGKIILKCMLENYGGVSLDRDQWRTFQNTVTNFQVAQDLGRSS
jgi:hypothetical protein